MPLPRTALSHLLLAVLALGGLNCPCAASAAAETASHESHETHHDLAVDAADCGHADCLPDCAGLSAEHLRQDAAFPCTGKYPLDDIDALETKIFVQADHAAPVVRAGPSKRASFAADTPVRRFDRLLD